MSEPNSGQPSAPAVAFIARGQLLIKRPSDTMPQAIESPFVNKLIEQSTDGHAQPGWRSSNPIWSAMSEGPDWAKVAPSQAFASQSRAIFTSVAAAGPEHAMLYLLHTDSMCGLFEYTPADDYERRMVHRQQLFLRDLDRHPPSGRIACSQEMEDGSSRIVVANPDGAQRQQVTAGDTVDVCPSWQRGVDDARLVYQSTGIGRDQFGTFTALGPSRIECLDLDAGQLETKLESETLDYLQPRMTADGTIYAIARPYVPTGYRRPLGESLKDAILFPWRVVMAIVMLINFISMIFAGRPLAGAFEDRRLGRDPTSVMMWGQLLKVRRDWRRRQGRAFRPLAPRDWQLIVHRPDGTTQTLADHVLSYDLCDTGVIYCDGFRIHHRDHHGRITTLCKSHLVERVVALQE